MSKVILAYPTELDGKQHKADSTVSVDEPTARRLIRDGRARAATTTPASSGDKQGS